MLEIDFSTMTMLPPTLLCAGTSGKENSLTVIPHPPYSPYLALRTQAGIEGKKI
jgi:hypothetical protein